MQNIYTSYLYKPFSIINCFALSGLSFMLFVSLFKNKRYKNNSFLQFLMMFMMGFTLILLMVEVNSKYVSCFKVYFIITAVAGMGRFAYISEKIKSRFIKSKIEEKTEK